MLCSFAASFAILVSVFPLRSPIAFDLYCKNYRLLFTIWYCSIESHASTLLNSLFCAVIRNSSFIQSGISDFSLRPHLKPFGHLNRLLKIHWNGVSLEFLSVIHFDNRSRAWFFSIQLPLWCCSWGSLHFNFHLCGRNWK